MRLDLGYIFESEWPSFGTLESRGLITDEHSHEWPGRCQVAMKAVDMFGNNALTLIPVSVE